MIASERVPIPGSERQLDPRHVRVGDIDPREQAVVSVYVAHRATPDWVEAAAREDPRTRRRIMRDDWEGEHGATAAALHRVAEFAVHHGLTVTDSDAARRRVRLSGTVGDLAAAFGARLEGRYGASADAGARSYRARIGPLTIPSTVDGIVTGVFGLDDRPQARPCIRFAATGAVAYTPPQVARAYGFPAGVGGAGHTAGVIELGGGYTPADLTAFFDSLGITTPVSVTAVSVDGGASAPGVDRDADGEVMLDIEVIGSIAPRASIVVYFTANTDQGFLDAVSQAVHDTTHAPTAISISWGSSEDSWTGQARAQMEAILTDAAALGITVTVAAGDSGSSDGVDDGRQHVDFPASAPHALGCGGTTLELHGTQVTSESVWDTTDDGATGGGISDAFALPAYQSAAHVPDNVDTGQVGRGVPDVAGDANPQTGYSIRVDGAPETVGGTSAVAPLWAALVILIGETIGAPLGFVQPRLYPLLGTAAFHDITSGSNGAYSAAPGWDPCTGLGTPSGATLTQRLGAGV